MPYKEIPYVKKKYFNITEIAKSLREMTSAVRYWEKEHKQLRPGRYKNGTRKYTRKDFNVVFCIWYLLRQKNNTHVGVTKRLDKLLELE